MSSRILFIDPRILKPHEKVSYIKAARLLIKILADGVFIKPILIDSATKTILDGHHRHLVAKLLRLKRVPCWCIPYLQSNSVSVEPRRADIPVTKIDVIEKAERGYLYPQKTTRHSYALPPFGALPLRQLKEI
jgi:ParB-like chromosome segregation protein Spo0J